MLIINFLIDYWYVVLGILAMLAVAGWALITFAGWPTPKQIAKIKEWLLWAVAQAESELGSETGPLKLRMVYDAFIEKFPLAAKLISFETFSKWVDEALDTLEALLKNSPAIAAAVTGTESEVE